MSSIKGDKPTLPPGTPQSVPEQTQVAEKVSTQQGGLPIKGEPGQQGQPPLTTDQLSGNKKLSAADAERLVSQAGYQRSAGRKRDKNFDVGDSQSAPIPLPVDDVDESQWEGRSLDDAQEDLTLQGATLAQVAEELGDIDDPAVLWKKLLELMYKPTEEDVGKLQRLEPERTEPLDLRAVYATAGTHFGVKLDSVAPGPTLVAAALLVAGARDAVKPEGKSLSAQDLARGVHKVVQSGNKAVADAKAMNQGINKNLSMHRTFVFKR